MDEQPIEVEVAYPLPDKQWLIPIQPPQGSSVQQCIKMSGILKHCPELDLSTMKVGVYGKVCTLDKPVKSGDRVEIYRPLAQNPMEARRNRARKG